MATSIVFFLLFILPFIIAPFGITQFENPKVIFAEAGVILLFLLSLFTNQISLKFPHKQLIFYGSIIFLTIIDLIFLRTNISFFGNAFRLQGIFLIWLLLIFSFLSKNVSLKSVPWFVYASILLAETLVMFFLPLNESNRRVGTFGEPNALAAFVVFLWPFIFFSIKKFKTPEKIGIVLSFVLVCIILFFSGSKSAMIALVTQLVFVLLQKTNLSKLKIVVLCLCIYAISYVFPLFNQNPYENRVEVWRAAGFAGQVKPFGWGFGNTETAMHYSAKKIDVPVQYYYVDSAHNIFLDWWVQGGVLGLGIMVGIVCYCLITFIKTENTRNLVLLLGLVTTLSFNPASVVELLGLWWLIGQGFSKK